MGEPARQVYSFDEYLRLEEMSPLVKHEFLEGAVWAMAGGTPEHAAVATNISTLLNNQLRDRPCRVYGSDLRVRVRATGLGTYPDVSVVCGRLEVDPDDPKKHTATNPCVLVEVLSPSTEMYDRNEKVEHYKRIESLQEIVLVAHDQRCVEVVRRTPQGWTQTVYRDGAAEIPSLSCRLPLSEVYRDPLA
jgi:Uma2 family endonuclease